MQAKVVASGCNHGFVTFMFYSWPWISWSPTQIQVCYSFCCHTPSCLWNESIGMSRWWYEVVDCHKQFLNQMEIMCVIGLVRGVPKDLCVDASKYKPGQRFCWWGFTSYSIEGQVAKDFGVGSDGKGTIFFLIHFWIAWICFISWLL